MPPPRLVLAITGASGAIYAVRLLQILAAAGCELHLTVSPSGAAVVAQELGLQLDLKQCDLRALLTYRPDWLQPDGDRPETGHTGTRSIDSSLAQLHYHHYEDYMTPIASGSFLTAGMIICPCSGSTLSGIARAAASNLIQRAAEVHLKEQRKLVVVPRETPLSVLQLANMQTLAAAGAVVLPAMPGWYHGVRGLGDLVDFVVGRILDQFQIDHALIALGAAMTVTALVPRGDRWRLMLEMIRFSHTLFALPFAALAAVLSLRVPLPSGDAPAVRPLALLGILLCMVFARSAAMAFNRLVDHRFDAANPRTRGRHLPAGLLGRGEVWAFTILCGAGFVASCGLFLPNWLPLAASLPVLAVLLGYSLAKRFTAAAHFWLGGALSLAPICVRVALRGTVVIDQPSDLLPAVTLAAAVAAWVAGFDIIYACQDEAYDRQHGLHSVPARLGAGGSLRLAAGCHAAMVLLLMVLPMSSAGLGLGGLYFACVGLIAGLLVYEHRLVAPGDLQRVNVAFFHVNALISVALLVIGGIDSWLV